MEYKKIKASNSMNVVIFDIDGCISNDDHRLHAIKKEGDDRYTTYHQLAHLDDVLEAGNYVLKSHIDKGDVIVFITARPEWMRVATENKLQTHFGNAFFHGLWMRGNDQEGIGAVKIKEQKLLELQNLIGDCQSITAAYDDRPDIIKMYLANGISGARILDKKGLREYNGQPTVLGYVETPAVAAPGRTAADILEEAGRTFRERNAVYKDNADNVGKVMAALFPNGVRINNAEDHKMYHLFELIIVKLTRFANSGLKHEDSIHDMAVYAAMCENLAKTHNIKFD